MKTEFEATFYPIDKDRLRQKLKNVGAKLSKPEFMLKRKTYEPPPDIKKGWLRVRDEQDQITLAYKKIEGQKNKISDQKEIEIMVDDFEKACQFIEVIGCKQKSYQENTREIWHYQGLEICLDTWPGLKPLIEIEGQNENDVKSLALKLGFDWQKVIFDCVALLYLNELSIPRKVVQRIPVLTFDTDLTAYMEK